MVRGRRLETRDSSLESSQRASLVSIRSSISSNSPSDLEINEDEDEEPSIANLRIFLSSGEIYQCFFASSSVRLFSSYAFLLLPSWRTRERARLRQNDLVSSIAAGKKKEASLRHIGQKSPDHSPIQPSPAQICSFSNQFITIFSLFKIGFKLH